MAQNLPAGFVATKEALERITAIREATNAGNPVLLNGPTGSAKTYSAKIALKDAIIFNCSREVTVDQFIGRTVLSNKGDFISFQKGVYTEAYEKGLSIIIDEINLAPPEIIQFMEASLDSQFLTIDANEKTIEKIPMHKNFKLVATQNPAEEDFIKNRNRLPQKFLSKFNEINFNKFDRQEISIFADQRKLGNISVENFTNFHEFCINFVKNKNMNRYFTVRDIIYALSYINQSITPELAIYLSYCAGFNSESRELLSKELTNCKINVQLDKLPKFQLECEDCIMNPVLINILSMMNILCIMNSRPILLVSKKGAGKTKIAKLFAEYVHPKRKQPITLSCTPETTNQNLIGSYAMKSDTEFHSNLPINWVDGPVVKAIENGDVLLLDNIDNVPGQVIERINPLLDNLYDPNYEFPINERPENKNIKLNKDFRVVATASEETMKQISPALINRFAIIYIDDQFESAQSLKRSMKHYVHSMFDDEEIIEILLSKINDEISAKDLIKMVHTFKRLINVYPNIDRKLISSFFHWTFLNPNFDKIPDEFVKHIISKIENYPKTFHFKTSKSLKKFIATLVCMYHLGYHVVLQSQTGFGKTSAAEALGEILQTKVLKVSFNNETNISDLYGNVSFSSRHFQTKKGPLAEAISNGCIFIADELNLADTNVLKSLRTAVECQAGEEYELPNNEETIKVHENYFFIGCQNDISMMGRNALPPEFSSKIILLPYPELDEGDLKEIIRSIMIEMDPTKDLIQYLEQTKNLVISIRKSRLLKSNPWSLREVRRLFNRFLYFQTDGAPNITFELYDHAAFMLLNIHNEDQQTIREIVKVISSSFFNQADQDYQVKIRTLEQNLKSPVMVEIRPNDSKLVMRKGNLRLDVQRPNVDVPIQLIPFWETYFNMKITHPKESILLTGPSGYKEYIAINSSTNTRVVNLNTDTTTQSLIGSIILADRKSIVSMLMDVLSRLPRNNGLLKEGKEIKNEIFEGRFDHRRFNRFIQNVKNDKNEIQKVISQIESNITEQINSEQNTSFISNYSTFFRPGVITDGILQQKTLILKNFTQPSISVIERLNELLSNNPILTLTEDYTNTLVPPDNERIELQNLDFKVIAICTPEKKNKLSEAMLSRLTVIKTYEYKENQFQYILSNNFYDLFTQVSKTFNTNQKMLINRVGKRILQSAHNLKNLENFKTLAFSYALHACNYINLEIQANDLETPLTITPAIIESPNKFPSIPTPKTPIYSKIVFTKSIQKMVFNLFFAAFINFPTLIIGPNGSGKSITIKYLASLYNVEILSIPISRSTTVENIFGQNEITRTEDGSLFGFKPTNLVEKIDYSKNKGKVWIVFEGIDSASDSLLDAIAPIFDPDSDSVTLPNGDNIHKSDFMVFGLASKSIFNDSIMKNTIIYHKDDYDKNEFLQICSKVPKTNEELTKLIYDAKNHSKDSIFKMQITIRTFKNYLKLVNEAQSQYGHIKANLINFVKMKADINIQNENEIKIDNGHMLINSKPYPNFIEDKITRTAVSNLTPSEKDFFAIMDAINSVSIPIIAMGPTASGKTHSIQLFAEAAGKSLTVLQLNADTSDSIITGGFKPLSELRQAQRDEINQELEKLGDLKNEFPIIEWTPRALDAVCEQMNEYVSENPTLKPDKILIINNLIDKIKNDCQFYNLIEKHDSPVVDAMKNGKWLLLDGIEAAPPSFFDKLNSLLSSKPKITTMENGQYITIEAHNNFRLFMTYNPYDSSSKSRIPQNFLNRCYIMNLEPIDINDISTFTVIFGRIDASKIGIKRKNFLNFIARMTNFHIEKTKDGEHRDPLIDGRTLIKLARSLMCSASERNESLDTNIIIKSLFLNYYHSIDFTKYEKEIKDLYNREVDENFITKIEYKLSDSFSSDLDTLIEYLEECKKSAQFKLETFISQLFIIRFSNYSQIKKSVNEILESSMIHSSEQMFALDAMIFIRDFINDITGYAQVNIANQSLSSIKKGEYQAIDNFKTKCSAIMDFRLFPPTISSNDYKYYKLLDNCDNIQNTIRYILSISELRLELFDIGSFQYQFAKMFNQIKRDHPIRIVDIAENKNIQPGEILFIYNEGKLDSVDYGQRKFSFKNFEVDFIVFLKTFNPTTAINKLEFKPASINSNQFNLLLKNDKTICYLSLFNSKDDWKSIDNYYDQAFQISCELINKGNIHEFRMWKLIFKQICRVLDITKKEFDPKDHILINSLLRMENFISDMSELDFKQFKFANLFIQFQEYLSRFKTIPKPASKCSKKKLLIQPLLEYVETQQHNYQVIKWLIDEIIPENVSNFDCSKFISLAKIPFSLPKEYNVKSFGNLFVDEKNKSDTDWFYQISRYSYLKAIIFEIRSTRSLLAFREITKFYPDFKGKVLEIIDDIDQIQSYELRVTEDLMIKLKLRNNLIIESEMIKELNTFADVSQPVSNSWYETIQKVLKEIPPDTKLEFPNFGEPTVIEAFIKTAPEVFNLKDNKEFMNQHSKLLQEIPDSLDFLNRKQFRNIKNLKEFIKIYRKEENEQLNFYDSIIYNIQINSSSKNRSLDKLIPLHTILMKYNEEMTTFLKSSYQNRNYQFTVGFMIFRLFANITNIKIEFDDPEVVQPSIQNFAFQLFSGPYQYMLKMYNYIDAITENSLAEKLEEILTDKQTVSEYIISQKDRKLDYLNLSVQKIPKIVEHFLITHKIGFQNDIHEFLTNPEQSKIFDKFGQKLLPDFYDFSYKSINTLFDIVLNIPVASPTNPISALFNGCISSIAKYSLEKNSSLLNFIPAFLNTIYSRFTPQLFDSVISDSKKKGDFHDKDQDWASEIIWNPLQAFINFIKDTKVTLSPQYDMHIKVYNDEIENKVNRKNIYKNFMEAVIEDCENYNKNKVNKNVMKEWEQYSNSLLFYVNMLPYANAPAINPTIDFQTINNYMNDALIANANDSKVYATSYTYSIAIVKKKNPKSPSIDIVYQENEQRSLMCMHPLVIFRFNLTEDPNNYEFKDCDVEIKHLEIYSRSKPVQADFNQYLQNYLKKFDKLPKEQQKGFISSVSNLEINFGTEEFKEIQDLLKGFANESTPIEVFKKQLLSIKKAKLGVDQEYQMECTNKYIDDLKTTFERIQVTLNKIEEYVSKKSELDSIDVKELNFMPYPYPAKVDKSCPINLAKINTNHIFAPLISKDQDNNVDCSFKSLDFKLRDINQFETTPFQISIPITGKFSANDFELSDPGFYIEFLQSSLKIFVEIPPFSDETIVKTGCLKISDRYFPINVTMSFKQTPIYISSEGNRFVYDPIRDSFLLQKGIIFTDEKIPIKVINKFNAPIHHKLSFKKHSGSTQNEPPLVEYDDKNIVSYISFPNVSTVSMDVNVNLPAEESKKILLEGKVVKRPTILQICNLQRSIYDDTNTIYAGNLFCEYQILFKSYSLFSNDVLNIVIRSENQKSSLAIKYGDNIGTIFKIRKNLTSNKICEETSFSIRFKYKEVKIRPLIVTASLEKSGIEIFREFQVVPCYIRFTDQKVVYDVPQSAQIPQIPIYMFDSKSNKMTDVQSVKKLREYKNALVYSKFSYAEINESLNISVHYGQNNMSLVESPNNIKYDCFAVEENGRFTWSPTYRVRNPYRVILKKVSSYSTFSKHEDKNKSRRLWFPNYSDFETVKKIIENHPNFIGLIDCLVNGIEISKDELMTFNDLKTKKHVTNGDFMNFLKKLFQTRIDLIMKQNIKLNISDNFNQILSQQSKNIKIDCRIDQSDIDSIDMIFKAHVKKLLQDLVETKQNIGFKVLHDVYHNLSIDQAYPILNSQNAFDSASSEKIKETIGKIVDKANVEIIFQSMEKHIESKTKYIRFDSGSNNVTTRDKPEFQEDKRLEINSDGSDMKFEKFEKSSVIPVIQTMNNIFRILSDSFEVCKSMPNIVLAAIQKPNKQNNLHNKCSKFLETVHNWIEVVDNTDENNSLMSMTEYFKQCYDEMNTKLYGDGRSDCIFPSTVRPDVEDTWTNIADVLIDTDNSSNTEQNESKQVSGKNEISVEKPNRSTGLSIRIAKKANKDEGRTETFSSQQTETGEIDEWILNEMKGNSSTKFVPSVHKDYEWMKDRTKEIIDQHQEIKVQPMIDAAIPLVQAILNLAAENIELFESSDAVILLDTSMSIGEQRSSLFTLFTALAISLELLHVPTNLVAFCDNGFQFMIKSSCQVLTQEHIQLALDAYSVSRKLTDLADALDKCRNIPLQSRKRTIYVVSDGLFSNLNQTEAYIKILKDQNTHVSMLLNSLIKPDDFDFLNKFLGENINKINREFNYMDYFFIEDYENILFPSQSIANAFLRGFNQVIFDANKTHKVVVQQLKNINDVEPNIKLPSIKDLENLNEFHSSYNDSIIQEAHPFNTIEFQSHEPFISTTTKIYQLPNQIVEPIKLNHYKMLSAFEPNKPTQFSQSTKGSNISLKGLLQFYITQGQEQNIFLEKNSGYVLSQSLFIIIDTNMSCFNKFTVNETLHTIFCTLYSLKASDFETCTIFVANDNNVFELCQEVPVSTAFDENSPIWASIYKICSTPNLKSEISSALTAVYEIRAKQEAKRSFCICFSDALISATEREKIGSLIYLLENRNTNVIGIGIGFNPKMITKTFKYSIWSDNPYLIPKAFIDMIKGKFSNNVEIRSYEATEVEKAEIDGIINDNNKKHVYEEIFTMLDNIERKENTYSFYYNDFVEETRQRSDMIIDPTGSINVIQQIQTSKGFNQPSMYQLPGVKNYEQKTYSMAPSMNVNQNEIMDLGKGKIWNINVLICQFWDVAMLPSNVKGESKYITKSYLERANGITKSIKDLGAKYQIVQNYNDAILCLKSGQFSQAWVICGRGDNRKPDECNENGTSCYIDSFIEALIKFHQNGGGLYIAADNNPLTYEMNKFLEAIELEGEKPKFRFSRDEPGRKRLVFGNVDGDDAGIFDERKFIKVPGARRALYGYNVKYLFEGTTISCIPGDADLGKFQPFIYTTGGNISNVYYVSPANSIAGDIILDGSFTRLFNELETEGTLRFIKNIAVWLVSVEKRERQLGSPQLARSFKAQKFDIQLPKHKPQIKYYNFLQGKKIEICFCIDGTKSMLNELESKSDKQTERSMITGAQSIFKRLMEYIGEHYSDLDVRYAAVFFRDEAMATLLNQSVHKNKATVWDFNYHGGRGISPDDFDSVPVKGGAGDGPEDWVQAFTKVLSLKWDNNAKKIMIMITDASCHGTHFNSKSQKKMTDQDRIIDKSEDAKVISYMMQIAKQQIEVCFIYTKDDALKAVNAFSIIYNKCKGYNFTSRKETFADGGQVLKKEISNMITSIIDNAVSSLNIDPMKETSDIPYDPPPKKKPRQAISTKLEPIKNEDIKKLNIIKNANKIDLNKIKQPPKEEPKELKATGIVEYDKAAEKSTELNPIEVIKQGGMEIQAKKNQEEISHQEKVNKEIQKQTEPAVRSKEIQMNINQIPEEKTDVETLRRKINATTEEIMNSSERKSDKKASPFNQDDPSEQTVPLSVVQQMFEMFQSCIPKIAPTAANLASPQDPNMINIPGNFPYISQQIASMLGVQGNPMSQQIPGFSYQQMPMNSQSYVSNQQTNQNPSQSILSPQNIMATQVNQQQNIGQQNQNFANQSSFNPAQMMNQLQYPNMLFNPNYQFSPQMPFMPSFIANLPQMMNQFNNNGTYQQAMPTISPQIIANNQVMNQYSDQSFNPSQQNMQQFPSNFASNQQTMQGILQQNINSSQMMNQQTSPPQISNKQLNAVPPQQISQTQGTGLQNNIGFGQNQHYPQAQHDGQYHQNVPGISQQNIINSQLINQQNTGINLQNLQQSYQSQNPNQQMLSIKNNAISAPTQNPDQQIPFTPPNNQTINQYPNQNMNQSNETTTIEQNQQNSQAQNSEMNQQNNDVISPQSIRNGQMNQQNISPQNPNQQNTEFNSQNLQQMSKSQIPSQQMPSVQHNTGSAPTHNSDQQMNSNQSQSSQQMPFMQGFGFMPQNQNMNQFNSTATMIQNQQTSQVENTGTDQSISPSISQQNILSSRMNQQNISPLNTNQQQSIGQQNFGFNPQNMNQSGNISQSNTNSASQTQTTVPGFSQQSKMRNQTSDQDHQQNVIASQANRSQQYQQQPQQSFGLQNYQQTNQQMMQDMYQMQMYGNDSLAQQYQFYSPYQLQQQYQQQPQ